MFGLDMAKIALVLFAFLGTGGGLWLALHEHDVRLLDQQTQAEKALVLTQQAADQQRIIAGLSAAAQAAQERAVQAAAITEKINAAPKSKACVASPPVRALLDGLRAAGGAGPRTPTADTGKPAGLPKPTASAR